MAEQGSLARGLARDPGARLFLVFWTAMVVADVVTALKAPVGVAVGGMGAMALLASRHQRPATAVAVVVIAWLFLNGFYEDRLGTLHWHGVADLRVLLVLVVAASVGSLARIDGVLTRARRNSSATRVGSAGFRRPVRIGK